MKLKKSIGAVLLSLLVCMAFLVGCASHTDTEESRLSGDSAPSQSVSADSSTVSGQNSKSDSKGITPAAWKVEDQNGHYLYMMGTIHATDDTADVMPDYIEAAYADCDAVAVEVDITSMTQEYTDLTNLNKVTDLLQQMMYLDGTTIKDHLSQNTYQAMYDLLDSKKMYPAIYQKFKPILWISLLENCIINDCGLSAQKSVDEAMTNRAKADQKEVLEVESAELQMGVFDDLSDDLLEVLISDYVADGNYDAKVTAMTELYENWKAGTLDDSVSDEDVSLELTPEQESLLEEYNTALIDDRNKGMIETIEGYLSSGKKVFVCVGAAHFYGDSGIVKGLEKDGYTVTRLS